jgi:hypothetical protein
MVIQFLIPRAKGSKPKYEVVDRIMDSPPRIGETVSISTDEAIIFYMVTEVEYVVQHTREPFNVLTAQVEVVHCTLKPKRTLRRKKNPVFPHSYSDN